MASFAAACRLSARLASRKLPHDAAVRGFRTSTAARAAQNFTMPALSPTMTEGNIASWRIKEGDKFSAGDVLLEIETDKATMDVEAQEDGILMKIMQGDGAKGIQVGTRIGVLAEEGDDISALEIPADESPKKQPAKEASKSEPPAPSESESQAPAPTPKKEASRSGGKAPKQTYPLLPSVGHLMKENGLDESAIADMTPTGPNGRLLKGDVLAYLGKVNASVPADVESRFEKASHLDLSNISLAKAPEPKKADKTAPAAAPPQDILITLPVSLAAAAAVQKKFNDTLGVYLPLSEFITRAADLANDELPLPAGAQPTVDQLFNEVLGLDTAGPRGSRGFFLPQVAAPAPASLMASRQSAKKTDIIDILTGPSRAAPARRSAPLLAGMSTGPNVFSLTVPKTEVKRAQVFLERVKLVLEKEPGRLIV